MKKCFKCHEEKEIVEFYRHKLMADGHIGKCKECTKKDNSTKNGKIERKCIICFKDFKTTTSETKRRNGKGGSCCSRKCYFEHLRKIIKKGELSHNWKGDQIGYQGLHSWISKQLGKPKKCDFCKSLSEKVYDWANVSRLYKRDLEDWIRLCRKCHIRYDKNFNSKK